MSLLARLSERIDDNGLTLPRGLHHVAKIMTGAVVLGLSWLAVTSLSPLACAAIYSLAWFLSLRVAYALDHHTPAFSLDLWCDMSLHVVACAAVIPDPRFAVAAGAACLLTYLLTVHDASP